MSRLSRRDVVTATGAATAAALGTAPTRAATQQPQSTTYHFFNTDEAATYYQQLREAPAQAAK